LLKYHKKLYYTGVAGGFVEDYVHGKCNYLLKTMHLEAKTMYRKPNLQMTLDDFILPFSGKMSANNCWLLLAKIIPWYKIEKEYGLMFLEQKRKLKDKMPRSAMQ
jgi:hypothetical protein